MNYIRAIATAAVVSGISLMSSAAMAGVVTFSGISASWSNIQGGTNVNYDPAGVTTAAYWGNSTGSGQSGYEYAAVGSSFSETLPPSPSNDFILGTFTHFNNPISSGTSITGIRLSITANVDVDGIGQGAKTFVYDFAHWETTNSSDPCANGEANDQGVNIEGCADRVKVNFNSLSNSFLIGGDLYSLEMRGFLFGDLATGTPATEFWTIEEASNEAFLRGRVTLRSEIGPDPQEEISEPGALGLLGLGLAALGLRLRRRRV